MDVAILGASGDCGRQIAGQLIASRLLAPNERLQLVGRTEGASAQTLYGLAADLSDAHAEYIPDLDVALCPEDVVADLWVVACGRTLGRSSGQTDRAQLACDNAAIFAEYANALAQFGQGTEIVVIVSNPVELGVAIFAEAIGRHRVIGIGAFQDTLRFRREIAADLGIRRQRVGGFMLGEHGTAQVPLWSSVTVQGLNGNDLTQALREIRRATEDIPFLELCATVKMELQTLMHNDDFAGAFRRLETLSPDVRVVMKPVVTHFSGAKTVMATANVTIELLHTLLGGQESLVAAQVMLEADEFYGLRGPLGVPVIVGPSGVLRVVEIPLKEAERRQMREVSHTVSARVAHWQQTQRGNA